MQYRETSDASISLTRAVPWNSMELAVRRFRWHEQLHEIPWIHGTRNVPISLTRPVPWNSLESLLSSNSDDTNNSMDFHGTWSAPMSLTRPVPWNSIEFCPDPKFHWIPWSFSNTPEFHGSQYQHNKYKYYSRYCTEKKTLILQFPFTQMLKSVLQVSIPHHEIGNVWFPVFPWFFINFDLVSIIRVDAFHSYPWRFGSWCFDNYNWIHFTAISILKDLFIWEKQDMITISLLYITYWPTTDLLSLWL